MIIVHILKRKLVIVLEDLNFTYTPIAFNMRNGRASLENPQHNMGIEPPGQRS